MSDLLEYKEYMARVEFDATAGSFFGRVLNTADVITFEGTSVRQLKSKFAASVEDYIEHCHASGKEPERACSGQFNLRIDPTLHRDVRIAAAREGVSLNSWIVDALRAHLAQAAPQTKAPHAARGA